MKPKHDFSQINKSDVVFHLIFLIVYQPCNFVHCQDYSSDFYIVLGPHATLK